jgi:tripartite motif-containing protein 71
VTATPTITPYNSVSFGPSVIQYPNGLAADGNGNIYVAQGDGYGSSLQILNSSLSSTGSINSYGVTAFGNLAGVAVNSAGTAIYAVDSVNNAVYEFASGGATVTSWSSYGSTSFLNPEGIAVDGSGNVYVADTDNNEVEEFTSAGATITEWAGGKVPFLEPSAVAVTILAGPVTTLYVADAGNELVQILSNSSPISWSTGPNSDVFGIAIDSSLNIYVADAGNGLVEEYSNNNTGTLITSLNGPNDDFIDPDGVIILSNGAYVVTDYTGPEPAETGSLQEFVP